MNYDLGMKQTKRAKQQSTVNYIVYLDRLLEIAVSQFKWDGLPNTVDSRYLEKTLLNNGSAIFFKDEIFGFTALESANYGRWNIYGIPQERRAYAQNGYNRELTDKDSVIIWNNQLHKNDLILLTEYAKKLYQLDQIISINVNAQKTPILIKCNDRQRQTMVNLYKKYDGNEPFIFADKDIDLTGVTVLNTQAPYLARELYELKMNIWNEVLTYLGVVNIQTNKKERLITDEVTKLNGGTMASRQSRLNARKQACNEINAMFGLNLSVSINDDNTSGTPEENTESDGGKDE